MTTLMSIMCYGRIYCPGTNAAAMQFKKRYNAMPVSRCM